MGHSSRERLTQDRTRGVGVSFLTPDQREFRNSIGVGRWQADAEVGAHAPIFGTRVHKDGTADLARLEADENAYLDLGGQGGRDFAPYQPC